MRCSLITASAKGIPHCYLFTGLCDHSTCVLVFTGGLGLFILNKEGCAIVSSIKGVIDTTMTLLKLFNRHSSNMFPVLGL